MKFFKIFGALNLLLLLLSCGIIKEGFQNPKKKSSDEFLVEKKSPLVMPPDFNDLPIPNQEKVAAETRKSTVKSLISGSNNKAIMEENNESISSIEKLILKQIKKN